MTEHDTEPQRTIVIDDNIGDYTKPQLFFFIVRSFPSRLDFEDRYCDLC